MSCAHAQSEAKFQADRHAAAMALVESSRADVAEERARKAEMQQLLASVQRGLVDRDASIAALHEEVGALQAQLSNARAEKSIVAANEARLAKEVSALSVDRDRQVRLVDSLRGLEEGLKAHESEQRLRLQDEHDRVHREWLAVKQALDDERTMSAHRIEDHAAEMREAARRAEEMHKALQAARDEAHRTRAALEVAESQARVLQEQVLAGQGRLEGRVAALGTRTDVDAARASALDARVQEVTAELGALQQSLADKERHVAQYRSIAQAAEESEKRFVAAAEKWKQEQLAEADALRAEVARLSARGAALVEELAGVKAAAADEAAKHATALAAAQVCACVARRRPPPSQARPDCSCVCRRV